VGPGANERSNGIFGGGFVFLGAVFGRFLTLGIVIGFRAIFRLYGILVARAIRTAFAIAIALAASALSIAGTSVARRRTTFAVFTPPPLARPFAIARRPTFRATVFKVSITGPAAVESGATFAATERRPGRMMPLHELRHLVEFVAAQRIALIGIELLE
jgi:hypothetical protein